MKFEDLKIKPKGIILSGGPHSVYDEGAPHVDGKIWDLNIPVLGVCYGLQEIATVHGGKVSASSKREYGHADLAIITKDGKRHSLFKGLDDFMKVWMSHGDKVEHLPGEFEVIANTESSPYAAISHRSREIYGIQFHPEVSHTPLGTLLLSNFLDICRINRNWKMSSFVDLEIERIRSIVGPVNQVIGAVSGGVDSTVAATLMKAAIGDRFHAVFVDNGLLRLNERSQVQESIGGKLGINLITVDASELFISRLKGIVDPEQKRKIIGHTFIEVFEEQQKILEKNLSSSGPIKYLLQGTLYTDVIESVSFKGPSVTIKTHHNVGGLKKDMKFLLIEPLRELFKDEVRKLGEVLNVDSDLVWRHPFPGPGLAIRILGEVTTEQLEILKLADAIFIEEIKKFGLYRKISQAFAVLLPVKSVGVMGDSRTYEQVIVLRAVESTDFMTADWYEMPSNILKSISKRIVNEVKGVNRVVYDVSSKPPSTIEWE
jgi:GMP synthase (glutamine-hydrolysing)